MAANSNRAPKNYTKKSGRYKGNNTIVKEKTNQKDDNTILQSESVSKWNRLFLIPIIFLLTIYPLIMHLYEYDTHLSQYPWFSYNDNYIDFFLYYKQGFFISMSLIMAIIVIVRAYINKSFLKFTPIFVPLATYAFLALLSSIVSKYRSYSFSGIFEHFESIFAILGYCLVVYYVYLFIQTEQDVKFIINSLLIGVLVLGLIGLLQYIGHDLFATEFGLKLITPSVYWNEPLEFTFGKNRVYLTLYNPNYVGVYVSLVLPVLIILTIFNKSLKLLPIYLIAIAGMILCLIGSKSTTGLFAIVVSSILALILLRKYLIKHFYISIPAILLVIAALLLFNKSNNYLSVQLNKLLNINKTQSELTDIQTMDDEVRVTYNGNTLRTKLFLDDMGNCFFEVSDDTGNVVPVTFDKVNGPLTVQDERFPGFIITPVLYDNIYSFTIKIDGHDWYFTNQSEDGTYYFINNFGKLDKIKTAPSALFTGYEKYGSGRGYLWSRSIPLLKKHIFLGSGADTFVLEFPQQDYVNLYNYGYEDQLITKPHSLYLQIGVQTGVLSLLALIVFYFMYFISSFKLYIKGQFMTYYSKVGLSIFIGTFSYLICEIANDSSITVAPVFWVLIGLGIAINHKVNLSLKDEAAE